MRFPTLSRYDSTRLFAFVFREIQSAMTILKTEIIYFGKRCTAVCDRNCSKAFGINNRPSIRNETNDDDIIWLADHEVPDAPDDPGTYEGGHGKPFHPDRHNKWCVRECERSSITDPGEKLSIPDFSQRRYNCPSLHGLKDTPTIDVE
jgi:hypothetical protein